MDVRKRRKGTIADYAFLLAKHKRILLRSTPLTSLSSAYTRAQRSVHAYTRMRNSPHYSRGVEGQAAAIQGVEHGVAGAVGRAGAAVGLASFAEVQRLPAERALVNLAVLSQFQTNKKMTVMRYIEL